LAQRVLALLMPVIILGGIMAGIVTPTEAAVIAIAYALLISFSFYKQLKVSDLPRILFDTAKATAIVMFMIAGAFLYGWIITNARVPQAVLALIQSMTTDPTVILLLFVAVYLVTGMFMDLGAAIILVLPILYPVVQLLQIDPILFGVITVMSLAVGLVTPPVGVCLFVAADIAKVDVLVASKAALPYLAGILIVIGLVIAFPDIALFIPRVLLG
jgi:C4-dicarboxylate transporter, DctM subunit